MGTQSQTKRPTSTEFCKKTTRRDVAKVLFPPHLHRSRNRRHFEASRRGSGSTETRPVGSTQER